MPRPRSARRRVAAAGPRPPPPATRRPLPPPPAAPAPAAATAARPAIRRRRPAAPDPRRARRSGPVRPRTGTGPRGSFPAPDDALLGGERGDRGVEVIAAEDPADDVVPVRDVRPPDPAD